MTAQRPIPVRRFLPPARTGPGVLVIQEIFGLSDYVIQRCHDLADDGFVVHAPDLYARLDPYPELDPSADDYLERGMAAMNALPWETALADCGTALAGLGTDAAVDGGVGVLGFCYGGGLAYHVAAEFGVDALVAYYGSALPTLIETIPAVEVPSLHHFGREDAYIPMPVVEKIRESVTTADAEVDFRLYDGANHAFDNPIPMFHHPDAAAAAWPATLEFLHRHLDRS